MPRTILFSVLFILICLVIVFVPIYFQNINLKTENLGTNYKFIYSLNNLIYLYDLNLDESSKVDSPSKKLQQIHWSGDGKVAFLDENDNLNILNPADLESKKISNDLIGDFFWSEDGELIYFYEYYKNGFNISSEQAKNGYNKINYYFYDIKFQALEPITKSDYAQILSQLKIPSNPEIHTNSLKNFLIKQEIQETKLNDKQTLIKYYLVFYDINSKKEIKRIEYTQGSWSYPIKL